MHTAIKTENEKIDFMFKVIQYVERQIVLFDSVEDAAFNDLGKFSKHLTLKDFFHLIESKKNEENISKKLSTFGTRLVFTAHPTQFYPPSVLDIISS
jgi:phosphoenolpyruvate carboxylase